MPIKYTNLVFEGGGVRAIASAGAYQYLSAKGLMDSVENVAGTSAGSMIAMLIAVGYTPQEIYQTCLELDFTKLLDGNKITDTIRVFNEYGYYEGNKIITLLEKLIKNKLGSKDITFNDLHFLRQSQIEKNGSSTLKDLYVISANISRMEVAVMSYESELYKNIPIAHAIRASMAIPGLFVPKKIKLADDNEPEYFVDGGVVKNYYLDLFDEDGKPNKHTLGFRIDTALQFKAIDEGESLPPKPIKHMTTYWTRVINALTSEQKLEFRSKEDLARSVISNTGDIGTAEFNLSLQQKKFLLARGAEAGIKAVKNIAPELVDTSKTSVDSVLMFQLKREESKMLDKLPAAAKPETKTEDASSNYNYCVIQ